MKKKLITEQLYGYGLAGLDNASFDQVVELLEKIKAEHPKHDNFKFKVNWYYESTDLEIWADRLETDKELERRKKRSESAKKAAAKRKAKKELEEIELYEKLAKKYKDTIG